MSEAGGELRLALLTNFVPPYRVPVFQSLARRVLAFRVLISTRMEADRFWKPEFGGLDVQVQKNFTMSVPWNHPSGFNETTFVHFPYDTLSQLRRFRPDVIISAEFGFRTVNALLYRLIFRRSRLVVWATISEDTEAQRSWVRKLLRHVIVEFADAIFTNGQSGIRYLKLFARAPQKLFAVPQTTHVREFASIPVERWGAAAYRMIYAGRLVVRKQVAEFIGLLGEWCNAHPERLIEFWILGDGPERTALQELKTPPNLTVKMVGNVPYADLPEVYLQAGALVLPTLADEWGLVVNEALAAGLPVLGSLYSQAVQELIEDGGNGWTYHIDRPDEVLRRINEFLQATEGELNSMRRAARESALQLTPDVVVDRIMRAVDYARRP